MTNVNECGNDSSKIYSQLNILLGKNNNSNILPCEKLPLPLANGFKNFSIDKFATILKIFFSICIPFKDLLYTITCQYRLKICFHKKMNKTVRQNNAFNIKTFDS